MQATVEDQRTLSRPWCIAELEAEIQSDGTAIGRKAGRVGRHAERAAVPGGASPIAVAQPGLRLELDALDAPGEISSAGRQLTLVVAVEAAHAIHRDHSRHRLVIGRQLVSGAHR